MDDFYKHVFNFINKEGVTTLGLVYKECSITDDIREQDRILAVIGLLTRRGLVRCHYHNSMALLSPVSVSFQ